MTKDELLEGFFHSFHTKRIFSDDVKKIITIRCDTPDEMREVMDWFIQNADMTIDDDHGKNSFSIQAYNGNYEDYNCVTCRSNNKNYFDYYTERADVTKVSAEDFFKIVGKETPALIVRPIDALFGISL